MKKLKFEIYIGSNLACGQVEEIVAFVILPPEIPKGDFDVNAKDINSCSVGFLYLSNLANYMHDWLELFEDEKCISATIHLNSQSQSGVLHGKEIIKVLDFMATENNKVVYKTLKESKSK